MQDLPPADLTGHFGTGPGGGVLVGEVEPRSPAAAAGVRRGDVIVRIDGRQLRSRQDYWEQVRTYAPEQSVRLTVWRDGGEQDLTLRTASFPDQRVDALAWELVGIEVEQAGDRLRVARVRRDSPADRIGLRRDDILLGLARTPLQTVEDFRRKVLDFRFSESIPLSVARGPRHYHVTIPLDRD